ncbi:Nn.00g033290.m01.CDS01 [Neocucurbitaria sp. VM-36]
MGRRAAACITEYKRWIQAMAIRQPSERSGDESVGVLATMALGVASSPRFLLARFWFWGPRQSEIRTDGFVIAADWKQGICTDETKNRRRDSGGCRLS